MHKSDPGQDAQNAPDHNVDPGRLESEPGGLGDDCDSYRRRSRRAHRDVSGVPELLPEAGVELCRGGIGRVAHRKVDAAGHNHDVRTGSLEPAIAGRTVGQAPDRTADGTVDRQRTVRGARSSEARSGALARTPLSHLGSPSMQLVEMHGRPYILERGCDISSPPSLSGHGRGRSLGVWFGDSHNMGGIRAVKSLAGNAVVEDQTTKAWADAAAASKSRYRGQE